MTQRIIKFRTWDKVSKEWCNPSKVLALDNDGQLYPTRDLEKDVELMQFTGLLDKNGKEIYEGDILKKEGEPKNGGGYNARVYWNDEQCLWMVSWGYGDAPIYHYWNPHYHGKSKLPEIIGNIYESPSLLSTNSEK